MQQNDRRTLGQVQSNLLELIIVAALLAFGIEIATAPVLSEFSALSTATTVLGLALAGCALGIVVRRHFASLNRTFEAEGVIICDAESHEIVRIHRYELGEAMHSSVTGLFSENPAQKKLWVDALSSEHLSSTRSEFSSISEEAIEYFAIKSLSRDLGEQLGEENDDPLVKKLSRNDLPQILLENRFLELFSRQMKDRPAFMDQPKPSTPGAEVVMAYGKNGEIYERFELLMPINSRVSKTEDGSIRIENSRFALNIRAQCSGYNTTTATLFEGLYLGRDMLQSPAYECKIRVAVNYKLRSLFSGKSWKYYRWIDQFMDRMEREFSFVEFIERIGWDRAVTLATMKKPPSRKKGDEIGSITIEKHTVIKVD